MLKTQLQRQQQRKSQSQPQPQLQPWESRSTLSESLAGLGTRLSRIWLQQPSNTSALSLPSSLADNDYDDSDDRMFINKNADPAADATSYTQSRSQSRGRDVFHSSGRGGVGNIRRTSTSRDPAPTPPRTTKDGPDDYSQTRGREMNVTPAITHSGRGGAGNIRSPSRGPASPSSLLPPSSQYEKDVIRQYSERDVELPHSSGRGGAGNITSSSASPLAALAAAANVAKSRSRSGVRSSGRGGAGNMVSPTTTTDNRDIAMLDELERLKHHQHYQHQHPDGIHSTGRGGAANLTSAPPPGIDLPPIHESQPGGVEHLNFSSGRGGAGNIRQASGSRTRGERLAD